MRLRKSKSRIGEKWGAKNQNKFGPMNNLEQENLNLENQLTSLQKQIENASKNLKETESKIGSKENLLFEEYEMMQSLAGYESLEHLLYREFGKFGLRISVRQTRRVGCMGSMILIWKWSINLKLN